MGSGHRGATGPSPEADLSLYNTLKAWRLEQMKVDKVPAYVIFTDKTLNELCRIRPRSVAELLDVGGIGAAKVNRYGNQVLAIIEEATQASESPSDSSPSTETDSVLRNTLKAWRLEQMKVDKVPAYVIFNDQALNELCQVRPRTIAELLGITGIGPARADRYGDQILAILEESP
jgi:ATP-dependent DNA helicase RecQ